MSILSFVSTCQVSYGQSPTSASLKPPNLMYVYSLHGSKEAAAFVLEESDIRRPLNRSPKTIKILELGLGRSWTHGWRC